MRFTPRFPFPVPRHGRERRPDSRSHESGMSLAEVMVAAVLSLIGFSIALFLYSQTREDFMKGEQAIGQQQDVRLAFDEMVRTIRLTGFNSNPDGSRLRTDEQIEGAWGGAVFVRGDFDLEAGSGLENDPELLIPGSFNLVSTGNDEIVGFVLQKPDGTGGGTITFNADVNSTTTATSALYGTVAVRDNVTEAVNLSNIWSGAASTQTSPPYTLYLVRLSNDASTWGTAGFVQKIPLAQNIKSLWFRYYNYQGNELTTPPGGTETATAIATRASIARIEIELIGLTSNSDRDYVDPADTLPATVNYRKFSLAADVTPRNLGLFGVPDLNL